MEQKLYYYIATLCALTIAFFYRYTILYYFFSAIYCVMFGISLGAWGTGLLVFMCLLAGTLVYFKVNEEKLQDLEESKLRLSRGSMDVKKSIHLDKLDESKQSKLFAPGSK